MAAAPNAMAAGMEPGAAQRFAALALKCLHQEYPNHISHTMDSDADAHVPLKVAIQLWEFWLDYIL